MASTSGKKGRSGVLAIDLRQEWDHRQRQQTSKHDEREAELENPDVHFSLASQQSTPPPRAFTLQTHAAHTVDSRCSPILGAVVAGVVQWQNVSFPSSRRGFDSRRPLSVSSDPDLGASRQGCGMPTSKVDVPLLN